MTLTRRAARPRPRRPPADRSLAAPRRRQAADCPTRSASAPPRPGHLKFILFRNFGLLEKEFAAEGIPVELVLFDGGSAASVALGRASSTSCTPATTRPCGSPPRAPTCSAVGLSSWNPLNETIVIARADSPTSTASPTSRATRRLPPGHRAPLELRQGAGEAGLTTADVESLNFGIETAGPALARGDVDAIVETRSTVQTLIDQGLAKIDLGRRRPPRLGDALPDHGRTAPSPATTPRCWPASSPWTSRPPPGPTPTPRRPIAIFAEETGRPVEAVAATYPENRFYQATEITDAAIASLKEEEAFMAANGLLDGEVDYDAWVDEAPYEAALALLQDRTQ